MSAVELDQAVAARGAHRRSHVKLLAPASLVLLDIAVVYLSFALAYWVRYTLRLGPAIQDHVTLNRYSPLVLMLIVLILPTLLVKGAYASRLGREMLDEFVTVVSASTITLASMVVITTMLHRWDYSRGLIVYLWLLVIALLTLARAVHRIIGNAFFRRGVGIRRMVVAGGNDVARMVMQSVTARPDLGYRLAGFVTDRGAVPSKDFGRFRALGTVEDLPALVESGEVDEIVVALPASAHEEIAPILALCERTGVGLKIVPDLFEMSLGRVRIDDIAGIPLLDVKDRTLRRVERTLKRTIDVVTAAVVIVLTLPLTAAIALAIRLESGSPVLLRQTRVGLGGKEFRCYKFRTMRRDALEMVRVLRELNEADGPLFKMRNDPRCTPLGKRLRQWSLDELPQIWNVLRGEMSLVGPRPPLPEEVAEYDERQARRLDVKPGMTGIWQVSGRSDLGFDEMITMDLYYVQNWSALLDAKILLRTFLAVLRRHGAY